MKKNIWRKFSQKLDLFFGLVVVVPIAVGLLCWMLSGRFPQLVWWVMIICATGTLLFTFLRKRRDGEKWPRTGYDYFSIFAELTIILLSVMKLVL